ncbi:hypothetical protein J1614_007717 [Plenodomus biglobosus]|nr:hypothetical protein J1614_007717 [Plenodomus biglobosus]
MTTVDLNTELLCVSQMTFEVMEHDIYHSAIHRNVYKNSNDDAIDYTKSAISHKIMPSLLAKLILVQQFT